MIITQKNLIFDLDEEEKTAAIVGNKYKDGDLIIPRSIMHESQEYIITSIKKGAFKYVHLHNSIQFSDSELRIIEKEAFEKVEIDGCLTLPPHVIYIGYHAFAYYSIKKLEITSSSDNITIDGYSISNQIEEISIPSNANFKDNWCFYLSKNKIQIVENKNKNIQYYDNKLIIGKSDINSDEFDVLLYANRDLETVIIPPFIKKIASSAFSDCIIESIIIPKQVTEIGEYSFSGCKKLKTIEFENDSQLQIIGNYAFHISTLEEIYIPFHVKIIGKNAFDCCHINSIEFAPDSELQTIGKKAFHASSITGITIPAGITHIYKETFDSCYKLKSIEFAPNSQLQIIEENAFYKSHVESLSIPSSIIELKERWKNEASELINIKIIDNGQHNIKYYDDKFIIGKTDLNSDEFDLLVHSKYYNKNVIIPRFIKKTGFHSFSNSLIESITITKQVTEICKYAFDNCKRLHQIIFSQNTKLEKIDIGAFCYCALENIVIPSSVKKICKSAFTGCKYLNTVEFLEDSKITQIDANTFAFSSLKYIKIPPGVTKICEEAFYKCEKLEKLEFIGNSQLQEIEARAFKWSYIKSLTIPPSFVEFKDNWGEDVPCLNEITFLGNNSRYKWHEDKLLLGKSDPNSDKFNVIVFACRDIKNVSIPSSIIRIAPYAFCRTQIKTITIPSGIKEICEGAFSRCNCMENFIFEKHSNFQEISKFTFFFTKYITRITIPSRVTKINMGAFSSCEKLARIDIPYNSKLQEIDEDAFHQCPIRYIYIPPHVTKIHKYAFSNCTKIKLVEINEKSELKSINLELFKNSKKAEFKIPSQIEIVDFFDD